MSRIRRTIGIDSMVGIAVIGNHDDLVSVRLGSLDHFVRRTRRTAFTAFTMAS